MENWATAQFLGQRLSISLKSRYLFLLSINKAAMFPFGIFFKFVHTIILQTSVDEDTTLMQVVLKARFRTGLATKQFRSSAMTSVQVEVQTLECHCRRQRVRGHVASEGELGVEGL